MEANDKLFLENLSARQSQQNLSELLLIVLFNSVRTESINIDASEKDSLEIKVDRSPLSVDK